MRGNVKRIRNSFILILLILPLAIFSPVPFHSCHTPAHASDYLSEIVIFNRQSFKYHKLDCIWAKRCTRNCVPMTRGEAIQLGGVACKVCGG